MPVLEAFKKGKYPQGDWSLERVKKLEAQYDLTQRTEAPAIIGHDEYGDEIGYSVERQYAHGWIKKVTVNSKGVLFIDIPKFSKEALQAIAEEKLKYMSLEIYEYDLYNENELPAIKAVALLGKDAPQIPTATISLFKKNQTLIERNEEKKTITFTRAITKKEVATFSKENDYEIPKKIQEAGMDEEEIKKIQEENARMESIISAFTNENEKLKTQNFSLIQEQDKKAAETHYQTFKSQGKLPPALFEKIVELDQKMNPEHRKELRTLVSDFSQIVNLDGKHFAEEPEVDVKLGTETLSDRIKAFQKKENIATFKEAMLQLQKQQPALFKGQV